MSEPIIKIPIGDWVDEYQQEEVNVATEEAIIEAQTKRDLNPLKLGRLVLVARERGDAPEDILPPNKSVLNGGAAVELSRMFARRRTSVKIGEREYAMRELVAAVPEKEEPAQDGDGEQADEAVNVFGGAFVAAQSDEGLSRAEKYLLERVPGYIWGRLLVIAANGGEVGALADILKEKIDDMVGKLEPLDT